MSENLLDSLTSIKYVSIKSDSLSNFFHSGTKWTQSLNRNLNLSLVNANQLKRFIHKLVSIEFDVLNPLFYAEYYLFPNEDICLFESFPHRQLAVPLIVLSPFKYNSNEECSCTLIWLVHTYQYYLKSYTNYINIMPQYKD